MWRNYLATALSNLSRNRLYAGIGIGSLAVGFAVALLAGLFLRHELSYDRFWPNHERTFLVSQVLTTPAKGELWRSYPTRTDVAARLRADFPQVEAVARLAPDGVLLGRGDALVEEPDFAWADPTLFDLLRARPVAGDLSTALLAPDGIVLTRSLARKHFGRDAPLGESLTMRPRDIRAAQPGPPMLFRVTGVIEDLPDETHLKTQAFASGRAVGEPKVTEPYGQVVFTYVRLRPGASADELARALPAFVWRHIPPGPLMGSGFALQLRPIASLHLPPDKIDMDGGVKPPGDRTVILAVAVVGALVLLAAAVNFVGLSTARAARRAVEVGVRKAAGARRRDLIAQFLAETLVQALIAFALALAIVEVSAPAVGAALGRPLDLDYAGQAGWLAAMLAAALAAGLAAGAYPALVLSSFRPAAALKGGQGPRVGSEAVRQGLVVVQFAVLMLLTFVILTLWRQASLALDQARRMGGDQVVWVEEPTMCRPGLVERVRALPGVREAACSTNVVLINGGAQSSARAADGRDTPIELGPVEFGFLEFYGLKPLAGRLFDPARPADGLLMQPGAEGDPPVVLNETAVRRLGFAGPADAVGRTLRWERLSWTPPEPGRLLKDRASEIIGVVPDARFGVSREAVRPVVYWVDPAFSYVLNVRLDGARIPEALAGLDAVWRSTGNGRPMDRRFLDQAVEEAYRDVFTLGRLIAACAGLALAIAAVGLFALAAYTTERRTKELGVRKALGAGPGDVARLLVWQFTKPVLIAVAVALPLSWFAMDWWLKGFADRVSLAPWTFAATAGTALLIAWGTVLAHTLKTAARPPVEALRYE